MICQETDRMCEDMDRMCERILREEDFELGHGKREELRSDRNLLTIC